MANTAAAKGGPHKSTGAKMHPDRNIVGARINRHEALRRAEVGRRAAEFKTPEHRRLQVTVPRLKFTVPVAAGRPKTA